MPVRKVACHRTYFPKTHNCSPKLRYCIPHIISPIVVRNYENQRQKCSCALKCSRYVTEAIFIKLALFRQPVLNNTFAEFYENPANSLFFLSLCYRTNG